MRYKPREMYRKAKETITDTLRTSYQAGKELLYKTAITIGEATLMPGQQGGLEHAMAGCTTRTAQANALNDYKRVPELNGKGSNVVYAKGKDKNGKGGGRLHTGSNKIHLGGGNYLDPNGHDRHNGESVPEYVARKLGVNKKRAAQIMKDSRVHAKQRRRKGGRR